MPYRINRESGTTDYIDPVSGSALVQSTIPKPAPAKSGGFLRSVSNALIPRTSKLFNQIGATGRLSAITNQEEEERKRRTQEIERIITQAKQEADPRQRSQMLAQARDLAAQGTQKIKSAIGSYEQETGMKIDEKQRIMAEALGVAGELGTFFVPAGELAQGAKLTARILQGAKLGAKVGLLHGVTSPEAKTTGERLTAGIKEAGIGSVAGGVTQAAFEIPRSIVKKIVSGSSGRVSRIFKMPPSERAQFRKSTGGMNFEEEILARDGKAIMGKNYQGLLEHFSSRADEAEQVLERTLADSGKAVGKRNLITKLQRQIAELKPEKGNVGTASIMKQMTNIVDDLDQYPSENIPVSIANEIKRQLQTMGKAAYSATGQPTLSSEIMAKAGSTVREAIESVFEGTKNPIKEANRSIQLYETARRTIERTGDKEVNKVSNTLGQKLLQMIPAAAATTAGVGGYATMGPAGGLGGIALATVLVGGAGAGRIGLLSPQFQTRLAGFFGKTLRNNGVKNFDAAASKIALEISRQVARHQTNELSQGMTLPGQEAGANMSFSSSVEGGQNLKGSIQGVEEQQGAAVPNQLNQVVGQETNSRDNNQLFQAHTDAVAQPVKIRNTKTGEIREVKPQELGQYGLATDAPESLPGLPSKGEILAAMVLDAQKGGKNIAKLMTILDAYDKVGGEAGQGKIVPASQAGALADFDSAVSIMDELDKIITDKGDLFGPVRGAVGRANPYAQTYQEIEADLRRATQIVGKAMEGGVLRKEDEIKYRHILPQLTDPQPVAYYKMQQVRAMLERNREQRVQALQAAGYNPETDRIRGSSLTSNPSEF